MPATITPFENGYVQISRTLLAIVEGREISQRIDYALCPDPNLNPPAPDGSRHDLANEPEEVRVFCTAWWTPERLETWRLHIEGDVE
jgi:hypothetical protein